MDRQLAIAALGDDRPGIVEAVSRLIAELGCSIHDSRMAALGGKFALILLVEGPDEAIETLAERGPGLARELGLRLTFEETGPPRPEPASTPCRVRAVAIDHPGIVHRLSRFFSERSINIRELTTDRYAAPHTGTPLFAVTLRVDVPAGHRLGDLRERLVAFADELNIDCSIEPITPH